MVRSSACGAASGEPEPHVVGVLVQVELGLDARPRRSAAYSRSLCTDGMKPVGRAVQQQERRGVGRRHG